MKKKLLVALLSFVMPLSLSGCALQHLSNNGDKVSVESSSEQTNSSITIAEAIALAEASEGALTEQEYQVTGIIQTVSNAQYGEMTIQDDTGSLYIYGVYGQDRETRYDALSDKPVKGDEVTLLGKLKMFKGKPEMDRGYLQSFKHIDVSENIDLTQYKDATIKEARNAAEDTKLKVSGTVTRVTYASGMKPNGFYLVSNDASIFVHGGDIAAQVKEGNKITVAGEKTNYVLDSEKTHAETFGYQGCIQLDNAYLVSNDNKTNEVDLSWCEEKTVKELMETPLTNNITTNIYKVNALVKKQENPGYVNYYIDDLDEKTGSYVYTMCNGGDFAWLDEFDGKICTVYLSVHNAKSTKTGCVYRLIPIKVVDENYTFDVANAPKFVLDYFAKGQFEKEYEVNPNLEVITSHSSELLGFENVTLTYTSSDENVAYFATENDKLLFKTKNPGEVKITIKATLGDYEATGEVTVTVKTPVNADYISIANAYASEIGQEVTVKGIIASSAVNRPGFYIIDESGSIAVQVADGSILKEVSIGQEVVVKGTRAIIGKAGGTPYQACIDGATFISKLETNKEYSTASFKTITFAELLAKSKDLSVDQTAQVYVVEGKVTKVDAQYYSNIYLSDPNGSDSIQFYTGNASQYTNMLGDYIDQTITMEVALCNWNSKSAYALCGIAVVTENGKIHNSINF